MDSDFLKEVVNPFTTTRDTRRVGLGIPLLKASAKRASGDLEITSENSSVLRLKQASNIPHRSASVGKSGSDHGKSYCCTT